MASLKANEKDTGDLTGVFKDKDGNTIAGSALEAVLVSIFRSDSPENVLRSSDDLLNDTNFTVDEAGAFTWNLKSFDTQIIDRDQSRLGDPENRKLAFEYYWNSGATGTLNNAFDTVLDSKTVTVHHTGHGMATRDHVVFVGDNDVGGLDLHGNYIITKVDNDTYTIQHQKDATSTVNGGGGDMDYFSKPESKTVIVDMAITRTDPV